MSLLTTDLGDYILSTIFHSLDVTGIIYVTMVKPCIFRSVLHSFTGNSYRQSSFEERLIHKDFVVIPQFPSTSFDYFAKIWNLLYLSDLGFK